MKKEFEVKCCYNCKECDLGKYCARLCSNIKEYGQLANDQVSSVRLFNEKFLKKLKIEKEHCCDKFNSKFIEYPFVVDKIENEEIEYGDGLYNCGSLVAVKPCGEEYQGKTYIGILLGDLPINIISTLNKKSSVLKIFTRKNPAILVPELKKIIFGYESWWRKIDNVDDFKEITNQDIENTWYVKLLSALK